MSAAGAAPPGRDGSTDLPRPQLSVVAPCFNEADGLVELHRRITAACAGVVSEAFEIVLVDDGSTDATALVFAGLARRDPHFVGVKLSRNYGHQLALTAGLWVCRGERILIIDADLQDPPELLGAMMALMARAPTSFTASGSRARARPGRSARPPGCSIGPCAA